MTAADQGTMAPPRGAMLGDYREIWLALIAIFAVTAIYGVLVNATGEIPSASALFGHGIGIIGFIMMLMTETLYSLRKRSRRARWGKMSSWLQFHIFTGIVGPYMVLLHSAWKFHGLAGAVMLLTVLIVVSGFIGRYIYTRIPRTAQGMEMSASLTPQALANARRMMSVWHAVHVPLGVILFTTAFVHIGAAIYYATLLH
jgi:hypothetical protein